MKKTRIFIIFGIIVAILAVAIFIIASSSGKKFSLNPENYGTPEFIDIKKDDFNKLISERKSFLVFIDQTACISADGLRDISTRLSEEKFLKIYHIMWSEARETILHEKIRYYPSFAIIKNGENIAWLNADSDEDVKKYKDYDALLEWIDSYILWKEKKEN